MHLTSQLGSYLITPRLRQPSQQLVHAFRDSAWGGHKTGVVSADVVFPPGPGGLYKETAVKVAESRVQLALDRFRGICSMLVSNERRDTI